MANKQPVKNDVPTELTPEQLAKMGKKFAESEYGAWFIATVKAQRDGYLAIAQDINRTHDIKLAAIERAAGIGEILAAIDSQVLYADHPELFEPKDDPDEEEENIDDPLTNW